MQPGTLDALIDAGEITAKGDLDLFRTFVSALDIFDPKFNIVTPVN